MPGCVVNQYMDVKQREVILWTCLVEIPVVDANSDAAILLWHVYDVRKPRRIVYDHDEAIFKLFDYLFFDLEALFWL